MGAATSKNRASLALCHHNLDLPETDAHIMPGLKNSLLLIGKLCDKYCTVVFIKHSVQVCKPYRATILTGRSHLYGPRLWRFYLLPQNTDAPLAAPGTTTTTPVELSAYNLPSVEALVRF